MVSLEERIEQFWSVPEYRAWFLQLTWVVYIGSLILGYIIIGYLLFAGK